MIWDEMPSCSANQLLANHLEIIGSGRDGSEAYAPMVTLAAYNDNDRLNVRLPCNHTDSVLVGLLRQLSEEDCVKTRCEKGGCGKRILTREDDYHLALLAEKTRRVNWAFDAIPWERLDVDVHGSSRTVDVSTAELLNSVELMLDTFKVPESASPSQLCPTQFAESVAIVHHLRSILTAESRLITVKSRSILAELKKQAVDAVKEHHCASDSTEWILVLPPNFDCFLEKWLSRVVNHVAGSQSRYKSSGELQDLDAVMVSLGKVEIGVRREDQRDDWDEMLLGKDDD